MKTFCLLILIVLALGACKKSSQEYSPTVTSPAASAPALAPVAQPEGGAATGAEIKYFKGSIGNALGLEMKLTREGDKLAGSYFYQKVGTKIELKGTIANDGTFTLEEFGKDGAQSGIFKGLWTLNSESTMVDLAGNWTMPDGQKATAFSLHEQPIYLSGGGDVISKTIKESNKKLQYEIDAEYPELSGMLGTGTEKFNEESNRIAARQVNEFKKQMEEPIEVESETGSSLDVGYTIALATDELVSVQFDVGTYFRGAAHPNSGSVVLNFDMKNGKTLKLADLFKPGSKYLQVLSAYAIKDLQKQSKARDGILDDESIQNGASPTSKNYRSWTITKKGLGLNFDSYQVGPYAAGPQYVLVPYSELKDLIEPTSVIAMLAK